MEISCIYFVLNTNIRIFYYINPLYQKPGILSKLQLSAIIVFLEREDNSPMYYRKRDSRFAPCRTVSTLNKDLLFWVW